MFVRVERIDRYIFLDAIFFGNDYKTRAHKQIKSIFGTYDVHFMFILVFAFSYTHTHRHIHHTKKNKQIDKLSKWKQTTTLSENANIVNLTLSWNLHIFAIRINCKANMSLSVLLFFFFSLLICVIPF